MREYNEHLDKVREEAFKHLFDTVKRPRVKQDEIYAASEYHKQAVDRVYNTDNELFI